MDASIIKETPTKNNYIYNIYIGAVAGKKIAHVEYNSNHTEPPCQTKPRLSKSSSAALLLYIV